MKVLALIALMCGAATSLFSQTSATIDAGISAVRYDGFLASGAASITPAVRWDHPGGRGFVSARGTYLRFESGNRSLDASVSGSWFAPIARHWRGELGLTAGASDYANIASFQHGAADARIHLSDHWRGGWVGATAGRASYGGTGRPVTVVALGAWLLHSDVTVLGSLDRSFVGDTAYSDLRSAARVQRGGIALEGAIGARVWSRGGGRGVYGEGSASVALGRRAALILSAGRYPTDVVSGSIAGRYVTAALRIGAIGIRRSAPAARPLWINVHSSGADGSALARPGAGAGARLEIQMRDDEAVRLVIHAPGAGAVEISGDFTDWQPVALSQNPAARDTWEATFRIAPGIHRINVRRDGGPWLAPDGTTRSADDFDGEVGVFLLP